jgi:hypothetical protein
MARQIHGLISLLILSCHRFGIFGSMFVLSFMLLRDGKEPGRFEYRASD